MKTKSIITVGCFLFPAIAIGASASSARAAVIWDESVDGLLSSSGSTPTPFTLSPGTSSIIGEVGTYGSDNANYQDFIALTIPTGYELSSEVCSNFNSPMGDLQGFTG